MKKINPQTVEQIREHARRHPEDSYQGIAVAFGLSEITVRRYCKGLGRTKAWRKGQGTASAPESFWAKVDKNADGCWYWSGSTNNLGYGVLWWNGRSEVAHRVAWEITQGEIPAGLVLDHLCKQRSCVRPDHLEPLTQRENLERAGIIPASEPLGFGQNGSGEAVSHRIDRADLKSAQDAEHAVVPHIKESKISSPSIDRPPGRGARSMPKDGLTERAWISNSTGPYIDPLAEGEKQREREAAKRRQEDDAWGVSLKKLGRSGKLPIFLIEAGSYSTTLVARTADDALSMFCSVWGGAYRHAAQVWLQGTYSYTSSADPKSRLSTWRSSLRTDFEEWINTQEGKAQYYEVHQADARKSQDLAREESIEKACEYQAQVEEELYYAKREALKRNQQACQSWRRWDGYADEGQPEYDDGADDD